VKAEPLWDLHRFAAACVTKEYLRSRFITAISRANFGAIFGSLIHLEWGRVAKELYAQQKMQSSRTDHH